MRLSILFVLVGWLGACAATDAERVEAPAALDPTARPSSELSERIVQRFELARLAREEDAIRANFEAAVRTGPKSLADDCQRQYCDVITRSDALAVVVFTPEFVAAEPWIDLLGPEQAPNWNASSGEGFAWRIENGALMLRGPSVGSKQSGVVSICDREQLRDFVLEFEFTVLAGEFELYGRLGRRFDSTAESIKFSTLEDSPDSSFILSEGQAYSGTWTFIGSAWICELVGVDDPQANDNVRWTQSRKGAIGLVIPPGTEVTFTRLRVKSLRQRTPN